MGQHSFDPEGEKESTGVEASSRRGRIRLLLERGLVGLMSRLPGLGRGGRFTRQVAVTLVSQVLTLAFALATSAILARRLGQAGKGVVALALLVPGLLVLFLEGGQAAANIYYAGSRRLGVADLAQNALAYMLSVLPVGVALFALLFFTGWLEKLVPGIPLWLLLISVLEFPFRLLIGAFCGILRGLQRITLVNAVTLLDGLVTLLVTVLLVVVFPLGPAGALLASLAAVLVNTVWASILVRRHGGRLLPRWNRPVLRATLAYGLRGYAGDIVAFFNYRLDMLLVNGFLGPASVGIYSVAVRLAELLWYLPNAVAFVLFPKAASTQAGEMNTFTPRILRTTLILTAGGAVLIALLGRPLIVGMYSSAFASAYLPLLLLLPGVVLLGGGKVLCNEMAGRGYPHYNSLAFAVGLVLTVVFDLTLIPRFGVAGASVASTLAYGGTFGASILLHKRVTRPAAPRQAMEIQEPPLQHCGTGVAHGGNNVHTRELVPTAHQDHVDPGGPPVFFLSRGGSPELHGGGKVRRDLLEAACRAGFERVSISGTGMRYFVALARLRFPRGSVVVLPYPGLPAIRPGALKGLVSMSEAVLLVLKKLRKRLRMLLYVYDLPIEQREAAGLPPAHWFARLAEAAIFRAVDVIGVMGEQMENAIRERHTLPSTRFVHYGFLPYYAPNIAKRSSLGHPRRIAVAGNLNQGRMYYLVGTLPRASGIEYSFYGPDGDWLEGIREDFRWYGELDPVDLSQVLNETADFGLVLYDIRNESQLRYVHMVTTSKFFAYVYAGLPILSFSYRHIAQVIKAHGLGYVFDDPARLADIVLGVDEKDYCATAQRVALFAHELASRNVLADFVRASLCSIAEVGHRRL